MEHEVHNDHLHAQISLNSCSEISLEQALSSVFQCFHIFSQLVISLSQSISSLLALVLTEVHENNNDNKKVNAVSSFQH